MEKEVRRDGSNGTAKNEGAGRREPAIKEAGSGFKLRQTHVTGCAVKKRLKPAAKRKEAQRLREVFHVSLRNACRLIKFSRTSYSYKARGKDNRALEMRLKELAACRPRYGHRRLYELLRREGWKVNHKKIHRIYVKFGLQVRIKRKKKRASYLRVPMEKASWVDEHWSMDFVSDVMENGRRFRILTIVDHYSRECPLLAADYCLTSLKVISYLDWLKETRGLPRVITVDNGSEFSSLLMDAWAYKNNVKLDFIRPGKPTENAYIESFNGKLRDEFLNSNIFSDLQELRQKLESWSTDYNTQRPHSAIGNLSPREFVKQQKRDLQKGKILNLQMA